MSESTIRIPLTQGCYTVVDEIDRDFADIKLHAHFNNTSGPYAAKHGQTARGHRAIVIHRIIMERILGRPLAKGEAVDHVDGDPLNNRRSNLRLCDHATNGANSKRRSDNKSGFKGVCFHPTSGLWRAYIRPNGKQQSLGYYKTPEEAHEAYKKAAAEIYGEFARFE
jgi:hypothetical protein